MEAETTDSIANLSDLQMNKSDLSKKKSPDIDDADCVAVEGQIDYHAANLVSPDDDTKTLRRRMNDKAYLERKRDKSKRELDESRRENDELRRKLDELRRKLDESRKENDKWRSKLDESSLGDEYFKNLRTQQQQRMCFGTDQMNESSSSKKKFTNIDDADCFMGQAYQGSPSGANTLNLGMQTVTSRGDIDQTAAGQLSAIRARKRPQIEIDQKYCKRLKSKLVQGKEISMELQKIRVECEQLKKCSDWIDEHIQKDAKSMVEFQSQISSLISINGSQNQHIQSFFLRLLDMYEEKDELKKEIEYLKKLLTQQQPLGFDINQLLNLREPSQESQLMQTGDEES